MLSARLWMEIVDGGGGAVMRCRKVVKIVVRGSQMSQGVMRICTVSHRRCVSESSSCPSACLCVDLLEWKRCARCSVSYVHVLVERPGCGQCGFGVMPKADDGRRIHRKARRCASSEEWIYCKQVQGVWCEPSARQRPSNGGGTTWQQRRGVACFQAGYTQCTDMDMTVEDQVRRIVGQ